MGLGGCFLVITLSHPTFYYVEIGVVDEVVVGL